MILCPFLLFIPEITTSKQISRETFGHATDRRSIPRPGGGGRDSVPKNRINHRVVLEGSCRLNVPSAKQEARPQVPGYYRPLQGYRRRIDGSGKYFPGVHLGTVLSGTATAGSKLANSGDRS